MTTIGERSLGRSKGDRGLFIFFVSWTIVRVKDNVKDVLFSFVFHKLCIKKNVTPEVRKNKQNQNRKIAKRRWL